MSKLKGLIRKYFKTFTYFYSKLKYRLFVRTGLNLATGVLDGFGLAMFLPLLQIVGGNASEKSADSLGKMQFLVDFIKASGLGFTLVTILSLMTVFFILKGIASYLNSIYGVWLRKYFMTTMRIQLSQNLSRFSYKRFIQTDVGRIQNTLTAEVGRISTAYEHYFGAFQQLILVLVYMGFAFTIDSEFALLISIGGGATNFIFKSLYSETKKASTDVTLASHSYQGFIIQFITNFKYLKSTGSLGTYNKQLINSIKNIEDSQYRIGKLGSLVTALREPVIIIIVCAVILIQVYFMGGELGSILISLLFFYKAINSLMFMQAAYNKFLAVSGALDNVTDFEFQLHEGRENQGSKTFGKFQSNIILKNASFYYGTNQVLNGIELVIPKSTTFAFVGESGSGKSTLVNVLAGLMPLSSGQYFIDGVPITALDRNTLQSRIGYITQEPVIFSDTIFNNVSFWDEPTPENLKRFNEALSQASILNFVTALEKKGNTVLGNNGVNLSGGQRQRISIARELYKDVDILIMDEATSALDSETEQAIQQSIDALKGKYTILIVAHRLATIKNADHIVLLGSGRILEQGSFFELSQSSTHFQKMIQHQEL